MEIAAKIVVLGAEGQLGSELCRQLGDRALGLSRVQCSLLDLDNLVEVIQRLRPKVVINAAAYTAVDRAEQEPDVCHAVNAQSVKVVADVCSRLECLLVQISTDYVFGADASRQTPYLETDAPGPINVYGHSKLAGEQHAATWPKHLIVRTCGLYGRRNKSTQSNFVDTMLRLARERDRLRIVGDQQCTPSYVPDVAAAICKLVERQATGLFHVVNQGSATWLEFAEEIFRQAGVAISLERITTAEYAAAAARPLYSVLDTAKVHSVLERPLSDWTTALAEYMADRQ